MFEIDESTNIGHHQAQAKCSMVKSEDLLVDYDEHPDGLPILSTGFNPAGERIIQSSIDEDETNTLYWFFQVFPTDDVYAKWRGGAVSWRAVLEASPQVFVCKAVSECGSPRVAYFVAAYLVRWEDVPEDYRPSGKSFIPERCRL